MFLRTKKGGKVISENDDGRGTLILADGSKYTGVLKNRVAYGEGTVIFPDGRELSGSFEGGNPHGQNLVLTFPDGRKFVGDYRYGRRHGWGRMFFPDGQVFAGEWKNDQPHGEGSMTYPGGTVEEGKWIRGIKVEPKLHDDSRGNALTIYLIPVLIVAGIILVVIWYT